MEKYHYSCYNNVTNKFQPYFDFLKDSIEKYENTGPFECDDEIENTRITSEASSELEKSVTKAKFDKSTIWTRINVNMTDKHNKYVIKNNDTIFHEIPDKMYVIRGHDLKIVFLNTILITSILTFPDCM